MIPAVDIQIVARLVTAFSGKDVRWMPSDQGRKSAYASYTAQANKGKTAVTVFRKVVTPLPLQVKPMEHRGANLRVYSADYTTLTHQKRVEVEVGYELSCWAYNQTEVDAVCRTLHHLFIYKPIELTLHSQPYTFQVEMSNPVYSFEPEDKTQTIRLYNFKAELKVLNAFWLTDEEVKTVESIFANLYNTVTNGEPVLLETLNLVPNPMLP